MGDRTFGAGLLALILGAAVLSGCIGDSGKGKGGGADDGEIAEVPTGPPAGDAQVSDTTGAIDGLVADEAFNPLPGARVTILDAPDGNTTSATADAEGRFVFNNLVPGSYKIVAERLGYDSKAISIGVVVGEIAKVTFNLPELAVEGLARVEPYEFDGFFGCGAGTPAGLLNPCFLDANNANVHRIENISSGIEAMVITLQWSPNGGVLGQKLQLSAEYEDEDRCGLTDCPRFGAVTGSTPLTMRVDAEKIREVILAKENETLDPSSPLMIRVFPGSDDADPATVFLQQEFKIYVNLFYSQPAPEGFTGLPDS